MKYYLYNLSSVVYRGGSELLPHCKAIMEVCVCVCVRVRENKREREMCVYVYVYVYVCMCAFVVLYRGGSELLLHCQQFIEVCVCVCVCNSHVCVYVCVHVYV